MKLWGESLPMSQVGTGITLDPLPHYNQKYSAKINWLLTGQVIGKNEVIIIKIN